MKLHYLLPVVLLSAFTLLSSPRSEAIILSEAVREGDPAPDGNGTFSSFVLYSSAGGYAVFQASLSGTNGGTSDDYGLFRVGHGEILTIIREGDPAPDGNGLFSQVNFSNRVLVIESGLVVFEAKYSGTASVLRAKFAYPKDSVILSKICSGVLVQTNGLGSSLCASM